MFLLVAVMGYGEIIGMMNPSKLCLAKPNGSGFSKKSSLSLRSRRETVVSEPDEDG